LLILFFAACSKNNDSSSTSTTSTVNKTLFTTVGSTITSITDTTAKLSDGTMADCYAIHTTELATDHAMGPWCPADTTKTGGIWLDTVDSTIHTVDKAYLKILQSRGWNMVNADGTVKRTTTDAMFTTEATQENNNWTFAQAQSNGNVNTCLEATPKSHSTIVIIPKNPKKASTAASLQTMAFTAGMGISLNGITYFPPEPVARITFYQNIAPLDVKGGHTGFGFDYHYHRAINIPNSTTKILGYMLDGYPLYGTTEPDGSTPAALDNQHGHETSSLGYHYHIYAIDKYPYIVNGLTGVYGSIIIK